MTTVGDKKYKVISDLRGISPTDADHETSEESERLFSNQRGSTATVENTSPSLQAKRPLCL